LQTFECAVCNQVLTSFAAFEDLIFPQKNGQG